MADLVHGRKKGGGSAPSEAPDSLRSVQRVQIVDLICEGPIKGLVNGLKSVYFDGVPVENADGSRNFTDVDLGLLLGTQGQAPLPGFDTVQNERAVGSEVHASTPVIQTILSPSVDHVRVTIAVPQLTHLDTGSGNLSGSSFGFAIDVQSAGGGYTTVWTETVSGKTTSTYKKAVRLALPGSAPWDVRVRRTTPEPSTSDTSNAFFWDSFTEITSVSLRYPNSACVGVQASAEQFSRVPTRAYDILAQLIRVPTNYDPIAGTYSGVWDGTFKLAWSNNPAWVFFDVATHPRYGAGQWVKDGHLNKWWLYQIGRYCDERVDDGQGGTEPRFTCNLYLQTAAQARQVLNDLASLFRAITYWSQGMVGVVQDAPADAEMLFTKANIVGNFSYQGVSRKTRHSAWTVYYNDLAQLGKRAPAVYVDRDLVRQLGGVVNDYISPIGCTSRGQATRLARWCALTEALGRTVTFTAGPEAEGLLPGAVFKVADPAKAGKRLGGRIRSATTDTVTLDASVTIEAGETYMLEVAFADATQKLGYRTEIRAVTNAAGAGNELTVSPAFSEAPLNAAIWVLQPSTIQPTWWRLLGRKPNGTGWDLVGVAHDPDKYAAVESGLKLAPKPTSGLSVVSPRISGVTVTESPYLDSGTVRSRVTVSWQPPARGLSFQVTWRLDQGPWVTMPRTSANAVDIEDLIPGQLDLRVETINSLGRLSAPFTETVTLEGWTAKPENVAELAAETIAGGVQISWKPCKAGNYASTRVFVGDDFDTAELVFEGFGNRMNWHPPANGLYSLWAVHVNTSGKTSATPTELVLDYVAIGLGLTLQATSQIFAVSKAGVTSPTTVTLTAVDFHDVDALTWTIVAGTASLTGTGATRTLAAADLITDTVTIRVSEGDDSDTVTIARLRDGSDSVAFLLSNEAHVLPADSSGNVTSFAGASTEARVYRGVVEDTVNWTFSISPSSGVGATLTYPGGVPTVTIYSLAGDSGYVDISASRTGYASPPALRFSLSKSKTGAAGGKGDAGANGTRTADARVYAWSAAGAPTISGTSIYDWNAGTLNAAPTNWFLTPGSPTPGYTLYQAVLRLSNTGTTATETVNWTGASISPISKAGTNGGSARVAYTVISSLGSLGTGLKTSIGSSSLPAFNSWGGSETWVANSPSITVGQSVWQTNGFYDPATDTITWDTPFLSALKVGSLSAISANLGSITAGSVTGVTITGSLIQTAASGRRVVLNEGNANTIRLYGDVGAGTTMLVEIGKAGSGAYGLTYSLADFNTGTMGVSICNSAGGALSVVSSIAALPAVNASNGAAGGYAMQSISSNGVGLSAFGGVAAIVADGGVDIGSVTVHEPYGWCAVTRPASSNFSYYGLTRQGQFPYGIGITTTNKLWIGVPTSGHAGVLSTAYLYLNSTGLEVAGGFGCNGKAPQGPYASGGTLAGVVAALIANGILLN